MTTGKSNLFSLIFFDAAARWHCPPFYFLTKFEKMCKIAEFFLFRFTLFFTICRLSVSMSVCRLASATHAL